MKDYPVREPDGHGVYDHNGWHVVVESDNIPSAKLACFSLAAFLGSIAVLVAYVCLH